MKKYIGGFIFVIALVVVPWGLSGAYMKSAGVVVTGTVIAKHEAFLLPGGDTARHVCEITYQYRPLDAAYPETVMQRVDEQFYRSLQVGSAVRVRYSPSRLLRSFGGMGLYLEDASLLSRLHYGPPDPQDIAKAGAVALAIALALLAYAIKRKSLGVSAGVVALVCFPSVLLAVSALLLFPALYWAWRRSPGKGYGLSLLTTVVFSVAVVYWRVQHAPSFPSGPVQHGTATVRQLRVVDEIWSDAWETSGHSAGNRIGRPFEMVDMEYMPEGANETIHALDRVDRNSVAGLREGATVRIEYAQADPNSARIAGATRNYARQTAVYLLLVMYGLGAIVTFALIPIRRAILRVLRASPMVRPFTDPDAAITQLAAIDKMIDSPAGDPRRARFEEIVAARHSRRKGT